MNEDKSKQDLLKEVDNLKKQVKKIENTRDNQHKRRNKFLLFLGSFFIGSDLKSSSKRLFIEAPKFSKPSMAEFGADLIVRITRPFLFFGILSFGILGIQTGLIFIQNKKISQQTQILEAGRRSNVGILVNDLINRISKHLDENKDLSESLVANIISLTNRIEPYRKYQENGQISNSFLSPEKGYLLSFLIELKLKKETYDKIYEGANFTNSDMSSFKMINGYFDGANLSESNMRDTELLECTFRGCNMKYVDFSGSKIIACDFSPGIVQLKLSAILNQDTISYENKMSKQTNLNNSFFLGTAVIYTDFLEAKLNNAHLVGCQVTVSNFEHSEMQGTKTEGLLINDEKGVPVGNDVDLIATDGYRSNFNNIKSDSGGILLKSRNSASYDHERKVFKSRWSFVDMFENAD